MLFVLVMTSSVVYSQTGSAQWNIDVRQQAMLSRCFLLKCNNHIYMRMQPLTLLLIFGAGGALYFFLERPIFDFTELSLLLL